MSPHQSPEFAGGSLHASEVGPHVPSVLQVRVMKPVFGAGQGSVSDCPAVKSVPLFPVHVGHAASASANEAPKTTPAGLHLYCPDMQSEGLPVFFTLTWMMLRPWTKFEAGIVLTLSAEWLAEVSTGVSAPLINTSA